MPETHEEPMTEDAQSSEDTQAQSEPDDAAFQSYPTTPEDGDPGPPTGGG